MDNANKAESADFASGTPRWFGGVGSLGERNRTIADQFTRTSQAGRADAIAHEPVVADADEPGWEDVKQEAAKELVGIENHDPVGDRAGGRVAITKGDVLAIEGDDARVADGNAVRVVGQIGEHLRRSAKWRLCVDDPLSGLDLGEENPQGTWIDRVGESCCFQHLTDERAKASGQHANRQKESGLPNADPPAAVDRETAARDNAVDVRMQHEGLTPGVKNRQSADANVEPALRDLGQRGASRAEEQIVKHARRAAGKDIELLGHGEDDVKVRDGEQLGAARLYPFRTGRSLTARAAAAAAGMPEDVLIAAVVALLALSSEGRGAARGDGPERLALCSGGEVLAEERRAAGSCNRAEIMLGVHGSLLLA